MKPVAPFAPNAGRESFFETDALREAFQRLSDAMGDREPFVLVTGEPGCGKTALVHEAIARWGEGVCAAWLSFPARTEAELVEEIVRRLGVEPPEGASVPRLVACFERALGEIESRGQLALLVVDDAHALELHILEELRLLVNAAQRAGRRIEVMLVGLPALEAQFEQPRLAALRQRISVRCALEPLSSADTQRYLHHRVQATGGDGPGLFARKSCREIATQSRGLPREINVLATEALRVARIAGQPTVCADHVRAAATSLWSRTLPNVAEAAEGVGQPTSPPQGAPGGNTPAVATEGSAEKRMAVQSPGGTPVREAPMQMTSPAQTEPLARSMPHAPDAVRTADMPHAQAATHTPDPAHTPAAPYVPATPHTPPTPQDPREWVKRFMGDQGPILIGSRAAAHASWGKDDSDAGVVPRVQSAAQKAGMAHAESARRSETPARTEPPTRAATPARTEPLARKEPPTRSEPPARSKPPAETQPSARPEPSEPMESLADPTYAPPGTLTPLANYVPMLVPALATLALVVVVGMLVRAGGGSPPQHASVGPAAAQPEPAAVAVTAQGIPAAPIVVPVSPNAAAGGEPGKGRSPGASAVNSAALPEASHLTLDVGKYLNPERAVSERDRLRAATGLGAWVVRKPEAGGETYHVVLGIYRSEARASAAADLLLAEGRVSEVTVVPLPPRHARR